MNRKVKIKNAFTLAEGGQSPLLYGDEGTQGAPRLVKHVFSHHKKGFTLAEVLITLGVIGVVAALTLPTTIADHRKKETATRLKKSYTVLSQALNMAQADHGDMSNWNANVAAADDPNNEYIAEYVETYIVPYLTNVRYAGLTTLARRGYSVYKTVSGVTNTNLSGLSRIYYIIEMGDGTTYFFCRESTGYISVYIDVNANKKKNVWGRDAFMFQIGYWRNSKNKLAACYDWDSREVCLSDCARTDSGRACAALIMKSNWEIPDDYPIKF